LHLFLNPFALSKTPSFEDLSCKCNVCEAPSSA
jgi:hypothetical protein